MSSFPAHACNFELFPEQGNAFRCLSPLLSRLSRIEFNCHVANPTANRGQLPLISMMHSKKCLVSLAHLFFGSRYQTTFRSATTWGNDHRVAIEIEKTNKEKILRDILKCHMNFHSDAADFCLVVLPKNYPHTRGKWKPYQTGVHLLQGCMTYGFGVADKLERILLMGFESFDTRTNEPHSVRTRRAMRKDAETAVL